MTAIAAVAAFFARLLAPVWRPLAAALGGWLARGRHEAAKDAKATVDMHRRMTDADMDRPRDADDARERLRNRRPPA